MTKNTVVPANANPNQTVGLSFYMLMRECPLYDRRVVRETGKADLTVMLIGSGDALEELRDKVLTNGQLLDTYLKVIVVTDQAAKDRARLLQKAPELYRFIRIEGCSETLEPDYDRGTLVYENGAYSEDVLNPLFSKYPQCGCVLLSTGSDAQNKQLAELCAADKTRFVAYVEGTSMRAISPREMSFSVADAAKYQDEIRSIAFNIHYAYEKGNDPHISFAEIEKSCKDDYNSEANIACALHIYDKLLCCGIDVRTLGVRGAASKFAERLSGEKGDELLNEMAQLEHYRWCMDKLLQGYLQQNDDSQLYSQKGVTTHSKAPKWHTVLIPYRIDDQHRHLAQEDWLREDHASIKELDELDRRTLWIHHACKKIALEKRDDCLKCAAKIVATVKTWADADRDITADAQKLEHALKQMYQGVPSAVFLFKRCCKSLRDLLSACSNGASKDMLVLLEKLETETGALREYVSRKDYKVQNLIQIRQIPFALSGWRNVTLIKLMGEDENTCVASAWQLEPNHVIFVDLAHSFEELAQIRSKARRIDRFLYNDCNHVRTSYHIIIDSSSTKSEKQNFFAGWEARIDQEYPEFFDGWDCTIHAVENSSPAVIRPVFVELMLKTKPDYIDLTGGKPELISVASGYAENSRTGAFFVRNNHFRDFYGASGLANLALDKGVTVQELFDQASAVRIKSDDEEMTGRIFHAIDPLWEIAQAHAKTWYGFCILFFAPAYRKALDDKAIRTREKLDIPKQYLEDRLKTFSADVQGEYSRILEELIRKSLVSESGDCYTVCSQEVLEALRNSGKVLEYYIYCTAKTKCSFKDVVMSWMFSHSDDAKAAKNELDVICTTENTSLFISAKNVTINTIKTGNFLNYVCYEVSVLANRFGINAKTLLAAPNVPQFDADGKRSSLVNHAMSRGVYLLGDECFKPGKLGEVLENIAHGEENWCEHLLPQPVGTK